MTRLSSKLTPKICKCCGNGYTPARPMQKACSLPCAKTLGEEKTAKDRAKADRKALIEGRDALKSLADHAKDTEKAFNSYIRLRDDKEPCISCGRMHKGQWHAGHYLSVGSHPELRFEEQNVHKQCKPCNFDKGGNILEYRKGLIAKIGAKAVDWLEGPHLAQRYRVEDFKELTRLYRQKARDLRAMMAHN